MRKPPSIIKLDEFDESINMLVYGDSGVGKTVFAGSADRVLFLGTEKGTIAAKRQGSTAEVWPINGWEDVREAYEFLAHGGSELYDWVIMDSVEEMQNLALRWILNAAVAENTSRDLDIPAIQDYQKWQNMYKRFLRMFCDLPVNVLFTATTLRSENEEGEQIVLPNLQGKGYGIASWTCAQMHVVGYLSVQRRGKGDDKELWRRLQTQTVPPYFGKDRYNCLGTYNDKGACIKPYLDNVTLAEVTKMISHSGTGAAPAPTTTTARRTGSRRRPATRKAS